MIIAKGIMKLGFLYDIEEYWIVEVCTNGLHLLYAKILNEMFNVIIFLLFIQVKSCVRNWIISFLYAFSARGKLNTKFILYDKQVTWFCLCTACQAVVIDLGAANGGVYVEIDIYV